MQKIKSATFVLGLAVLLGGQVAYGASPTLYFEPSAGEVGVKREIALKILADSEEPLNAYEVRVRYPSQLLEFVRADDSRSIISIWQERPTLYGAGEIRLAGGSFTAFKGRGGELVTLRFRALRSGFAELQFGRVAFYRADGRGTEVIPRTQRASFSVGQVATSIQEENGEKEGMADIFPPEIIFLEVVPDPFDPYQKLLSFLAVDRGSGLSGTFVRSRSLFAWSPWQEVSNPAPLPKNVWAVQFRATDNLGNVAEAVRYDWSVLARDLVWPAVIVALLAALVINRRRRLKKGYNKK